MGGHAAQEERLTVQRWPISYNRFGFILLGWAALFLLNACATETSDHDGRLGDFVEELIYGGPFDAAIPQARGVWRWTGEITVAVQGPGSGTYQDTILDRTRSMARLAGLAVRPADEGEAATFVVRLSTETNFEVRREFVRCYANLDSKDGRIVSAQVVISLGNAKAPPPCMAHELMHAFGFGNHSAIVRSVLSPVHGETDLTPWDRLALRVLYDRRLKPGMSRNAARPVIDELIDEFLN